MRRQIHKASAHSGNLIGINTDAIWALISLISLPIAAMSFSAFGLYPLLSFLLACCVTFLILVAEALVRGRVWFMHGPIQAVIGHEDIGFRILVVAGGLLLLVQSFLVVEFIYNPNTDYVMLNLVAKKQCTNPQTNLAAAICPLFGLPLVSAEQYYLTYSLENLSKAHLLPNSTYGQCAILLLNKPGKDSTITARFLSRCFDEQGKLTDKLINTELLKDDQGFYSPLAWSEENSPISQQYFSDPSYSNRLNSRIKIKIATEQRLYGF